MTAVVRTLTIKSGKLADNYDLVLTFEDPSNDKLWRTQYPTAWKVLKLSKGSNNMAVVTYVSQLAVSNVQYNVGSLVYPTIWNDIGPGRTATLTSDQDGPHINVTDTPSIGELVNFKNSTSGPSDLAIGFDVNDNYNLAMVQKGVGKENTAGFLFHPVVAAYAATGYKETQLLTSQISSPKLWSANLVSLSTSTTLVFSVDASGEIHLDQA